MSLIRFAAAASVALLLAGCSEAQDASEGTTGDSVETPADEAMADAPMPAEDASAVESAADQARAAAESMEEVEENAEQAAQEAQAAVDDIEAIESAVTDAEQAMD